MGQAWGQRSLGDVSLSWRQGSLAEIDDEADPRVLRLFVVTPLEFRAEVLSDFVRVRRLRSLSSFGVFLLDEAGGGMTIRLKKKMAQLGCLPSFFGYLPADQSQNDVAEALARAAESLYLKCSEEYFRSLGAIRELETQAMHELGHAFSPDSTLEEVTRLILDKCIAVSQSDAGHIFVSDSIFENPATDGRSLKVIGKIGKTLKLSASVCRSHPVTARDQILNRETEPLIRSVVENGRAASWDAVDGMTSTHSSPPGEDFVRPEFFVFDEKEYGLNNYCVVPLKVPTGEVVGCLILINRVSGQREAPLSRLELQQDSVPFGKSQLMMLEALMQQAGMSLDHERLLKNLKTVFESFVKASVVAIESRDPTTKGHSVRVAELSVALAEAVNKETTGPLASLQFSSTQIYELKYAALLHDFGKIGVREDVLQKEKKLFPNELSQIRERFLNLERQLYLKCLESYLEGLMKRNQVPQPGDIKRIEKEVDRISRELGYFWNTIVEANEPQVVKSGHFQAIAEIAAIRVLMNQEEVPLLSQREVSRLSIRKGSLSADERIEIEKHVTHSYNFLLQIPWTEDLADLPGVVYAHHERVDGTGYPRGLKGDEIPVQARLMAVCDVYDALVAMDRPYKKSIPHDRAMSILEAEVKDKKLDPELFRVFREHEIFRRILDASLKVAS